MIEDAVVAILLADAGVTALVADRVLAPPAALGTQAPYVTHRRLATTRVRALAGPSGLADARLRLDCWGRDRAGVSGAAEAADVAQAVRRALDGFAGTAAGVAVRASTLSDEANAFESDTRLHRVSLDFLISFVES